MNANDIADIIEQQIAKATDRLAERTYKRGIISAVSGRKADVKIEGNTVATKGVICLGSYSPVVGHKVLVLSIGRTGANLVIMGSING